jgi:zinc protease
MTASVLAGARYDPESKAGLAIMVSRLLDEGTENRSSLKLPMRSNLLAGPLIPMDLSNEIIATASVLHKDVDLGLELLADLMIRPTFPQELR